MIVVTGGGSGIGRCTAHELAALGATVALIGRKADKLDAVAAEIAEDGGKASAHPCDIREEEAVAATVAAILKAHGRIDGLVNNAGGQFPAPLAAISQKGWETVVRTNLTGGFLMARECYTQWMRAHGGAIVNIVSRHVERHAGHGPLGRRAGRDGQLHRDGRRRVVALRRARQCRGARLDRLLGHGPVSRPRCTPASASCKDLCPLGRMGSESEVSAAIVFLLSEGAAFVSGATLRVDGAVPNAKISRPMPPNKTPAKGFNGFHRAALPKVLREDVIPGLIPGIQPSANAGASGAMDPGHKARDDN